MSDTTKNNNPETDKSPCELIDEEEAKNSPIKDTIQKLKSEEERDKKLKEKKDKEENKNEKKEHRHSDNRTDDEKLRDELRCKIDLMTYQHRYRNLEKHLEDEQKRSEIKAEAEIEDLLFQQKRRKITQQSELLTSQLELRTKQDRWKMMVDRKPEYLTDPIQINDLTGESELVISDRIIELSGPITYYTSEYVTDLIHYYNNSSPVYPIFLIIDYSPGGSVMSGYRILKTMEASSAPVYVVVKSYAASMAAMIASMAKHSFIYPNAIILHHQILTHSKGNLKQHQEQVKDLEEWFLRLAGPFAKKLNIELQDFIDKMYQNNSDGDWREFGDKAVEIGWITTLIHRIRMTGTLDRKKLGLKEEMGDDHDCVAAGDNGTKESKFELRPFDHLWIHDPNGYYK